MTLEYFQRLGMDVTRADAARLVVYDRYGNPIALAIEIDNHTIFETAENPVAFNQLLRQMGIDKTVVLQKVKQTPIGDIRV